MHLGFDIYRDTETKQIIKVKNSSTFAGDLYSKIRDKEDIQVMFRGKDITEDLINLVWNNFVTFECWFKERLPSNNAYNLDYMKEIKEKSISLTEYLESKNRKVTVKVSFVFEGEFNFKNLLNDFGITTKEDLLDKIKQDDVMKNQDPLSAFRDIMFVMTPNIKTEIIEK